MEKKALWHAPVIQLNGSLNAQQNICKIIVFTTVGYIDLECYGVKVNSGRI